MFAGVMCVILTITLLYVLNCQDSYRESFKKEYKELYNKNVDLELEIDKLKINPFYGHSKLLGFTLEELKELKHFCDRHRFVIHDIIKSMDTNEERANDAEKIVLKVAKNKYAPRKAIDAYIKKWGVK